MNLKKLKYAREKGFVFDQIKNLTIKIYSNLSNVIVCYYLKFQIHLCIDNFQEQILKIQRM